jgi:hypothetical protein
MSSLEIKGSDYLRRLLVTYKVSQKELTVICSGSVAITCIVEKVSAKDDLVRLCIIKRSSKVNLSPPYYLYFNDESIFTKLEHCHFLAKSIQFKFVGKYYEKNKQISTLRGLNQLTNEIKFISQELQILEVVSISNGIVSVIIEDNDQLITQKGLYITNVIMQYGCKEMLINFKVEGINQKTNNLKKIELRIVKIDENDLRFINNVDKINDKITA